MACNRRPTVLQDGEFWLPPQFLSDDETLPAKFCAGAGNRFSPPVNYGNGWRTSDLSFPGDSIVGSAEESDNEEDFIADLTRKVAQSTLEDDFAPLNLKGLFPSGSPKSTLCGACGCGNASNRGIPNGMTQMKPVHPPMLDVLYRAAGKVANMRLSQQQQQNARIQYLQQQQQQQRRGLNDLIRLHNSKSDVSLYHNQASSHFNPLLAWGSSGSKYEKADIVTSSTALPTLQQTQQPRRVQGNTISSDGAVGMSALFLGTSDGYRRGSSGTGVFLPRQAGVGPEPKKNQRCSTVLIPAKVVQALNLNMDEMNPQPLFTSSHNARLAPEIYGAGRFRNGGHLSQPEQMTTASVRSQAAVHPEISLPSEWTY